MPGGFQRVRKENTRIRRNQIQKNDRDVILDEAVIDGRAQLRLRRKRLNCPHFLQGVGFFGRGAPMGRRSRSVRSPAAMVNSAADEPGVRQFSASILTGMVDDFRRQELRFAAWRPVRTFLSFRPVIPPRAERRGYELLWLTRR
jgi:hypothetical protein